MFSERSYETTTSVRHLSSTWDIVKSCMWERAPEARENKQSNYVFSLLLHYVIRPLFRRFGHELAGNYHFVLEQKLIKGRGSEEDEPGADWHTSALIPTSCMISKSLAMTNTLSSLFRGYVSNEYLNLFAPTDCHSLAGVKTGRSFFIYLNRPSFASDGKRPGLRPDSRDRVSGRKRVPYDFFLKGDGESAQEPAGVVTEIAVDEHRIIRIMMLWGKEFVCPVEKPKKESPVEEPEKKSAEKEEPEKTGLYVRYEMFFTPQTVDVHRRNGLSVEVDGGRRFWQRGVAYSPKEWEDHNDFVYSLLGPPRIQFHQWCRLVNSTAYDEIITPAPTPAASSTPVTPDISAETDASDSVGCFSDSVRRTGAGAQVVPESSSPLPKDPPLRDPFDVQSQLSSSSGSDADEISSVVVEDHSTRDGIVSSTSRDELEAFIQETLADKNFPTSKIFYGREAELRALRAVACSQNFQQRFNVRIGFQDVQADPRYGKSGDSPLMVHLLGPKPATSLERAMEPAVHGAAVAGEPMLDGIMGGTDGTNGSERTGEVEDRRFVKSTMIALGIAVSSVALAAWGARRGNFNFY